MAIAKERGAATLKIDLAGGVITVRHGESNEILAYGEVREGAWRKLFDGITDVLTVYKTPTKPKPTKKYRVELETGFELIITAGSLDEATTLASRVVRGNDSVIRVKLIK